MSLRVAQVAVLLCLGLELALYVGLFVLLYRWLRAWAVTRGITLERRAARLGAWSLLMVAQLPLALAMGWLCGSLSGGGRASG